MAYVSSMNEQESAVTDTDRQNMINKAMATCYNWFDKDRNAKQWFNDEMEEMNKLYKGDHWNLKGPGGHVLRTDKQKRTRPNAVENVTFALVEGLVAEFSQDLDIVDFPVEEGDEEAAEKMTNLKKFIANKNRIEWEREKWLRWFFLYGNGIWHTYWDPSWVGGRGPNRWNGDIRWIALHPQALFPDARCRESIEDGRRVHKAFYHTVEEIREKYPENGALVQSDIIREDMLVGEEIRTEPLENDEDQALVVETWYKGEPLILDDGEENQGPGLHVIWWAGDGQTVYLKHANYVYFEPGEDAAFPFIMKPCYPRENSVWGYGEPYFIKSQQIILNKTSELIIEGHMHHNIGQTIYTKGAVNGKQKKEFEEKGTVPGWWFEVDDIQGVERLFGQGIPASFQNEVERLQKSMETIIGRFDITQGRAPSSVTAFRALDLLAQRSQVRLRSKEMAMTSAYEDVGKYINTLITKFYTERRAFRIIGKPDGGEGVVETAYDTYRSEEMMKVFDYNTGEVVPFTEFIPNEETQEGIDYEVYSPDFDVYCGVSTTLPTDRLFYMDMAKELYAGQLIDAETFWYVMENGKFPPFEEMRQKAAEQQAMMDEMQAQMLQQQAGMDPEGEVPEEAAEEEIPPEEIPMEEAMEEEPAPTNIEAILEQYPELAAQLQNLPPEQIAQVFREYVAQVEGGEADVVTEG